MIKSIKTELKKPLWMTDLDCDLKQGCLRYKIRSFKTSIKNF